MKILIVFGTRPEAIKLAPLINILKSNKFFDIKVCNTGQHTAMLDQVLNLFGIIPDFSFRIMRDNQSLTYITSQILNEFDILFEKYKPDLVIVHGDTTTTLSATISSFYHKVKICHVEAGLRTGNIQSPWPEEANRRITSVLADYHFAPTKDSFENLIKEGVNPKNILITGNTVIDSLIFISKMIDDDIDLYNKLAKRFNFTSKTPTMILVTSHRRENFGSGIEEICKALVKIASVFKDILIVYPVHLNPNIKEPVYKILAGIENIKLIEPLDYLEFIFLLKKCYLILTDSGGIQEEAPALNKPVLLMRDSTERPEAIAAGTVRIVGSNSNNIYKAVEELMLDRVRYDEMALSINPFGDGTSSVLIAQFLEAL
jgi:UDP-N-acetylglucosamine 2-epimerase (non-hydrolysing)